MDNTQEDSTLSVTANVAGILTFVVAILAAAYVRITYLRNSDLEYFHVKTSLAWYKTESEWLAQLVKAAGDRPNAQHEPEYQIYSFVMDDLLRLEKRILELVDAVEEKAGSRDEHPKGKHWAVIPQNWRITTAVAVASVKREALTARVSFTQTSMIASRIRDLERGGEIRGDKISSSLQNLEAILERQKAEIYRLEDLLYRTMHKDHIIIRGAEPLASPPRCGWPYEFAAKGGFEAFVTEAEGDVSIAPMLA
ncbi:hypothetical protein NUW58_g3781 [Xylaria curta]|uniref:Uncharacterized protein n=1 Tax=Xylaria curta TaxID=42375 RepID=A0ACC1P9C4_9PEZI|nr:hypothetical protein NUW58_g3781 [Xylaria curta]